MERRGLVRHVQENTDLNVIWQVIEEDLPPLKQVVIQILTERKIS
jgi:uncharacterized protein with HEPN domain